MNTTERSEYYRGYISGYIAGVSDARNGRAQLPDTADIKTFPIGIMTVSTRGRNCLIREGCVTIGDVAALDDDRIRTMRSIGVKTAREIACWLEEHGIPCSAWSKYL